MKNLRSAIAVIVLVAMTTHAAGQQPPSAVTTSETNVANAAVTHDAGFHRYINRKALADAWTALNSAGIADGTLQTLEAERVLGRPEPQLSAQQLFTLATRIALEQNDHASLERLKKAATRANRPELVTSLVIAQKTAGPSRGGKDIAPVTPQDSGVPTYAVYRAYQHDIQAARLCGDARSLATITSELEVLDDSIFTEPQRDGLLAQVKVAAADADSASEIPEALSRLVSESRDGIRYQGIYTHWDTSPDSGDVSTLGIVETSPSPQQRHPAATGPELGQQRAGQSTNGQMSYETRQAALQLLRSPNGIKPSFARPTPNQQRP